MRIATWVTCLLLIGCATAPPNTPGAGAGDAYTPVIDMAGLDMGRYSQDLDGCRTYARQIDPNRAAMNNMIGGIIVGALVGAAAGGNRHWAEQGAVYGGTVGSVRGGARAVMTQEVIMANCMAGRGYRVMYGATVPTNTTAPSPYIQTAHSPGAPAGPAPSIPTTQPSSVIPGCGYVGYQWKCQ